MHNQYAGLSQTLAEQHTTDLPEQATHQRLLAAAHQPRRRHTCPTRRWWQLPDRRPSPETS